MTFFKRSLENFLNISCLFNPLWVCKYFFFNLFFLKQYNFLPFKWEVESTKAMAFHMSQYSPVVQKPSAYRLSICIVLQESIIHSQNSWLDWSFAIPMEWKWYFLTKCNFLEQTNRQVLMKKNSRRWPLSLQRSYVGTILFSWCLFHMHFDTQSLLALCFLIKYKYIFTY